MSNRILITGDLVVSTEKYDTSLVDEKLKDLFDSAILNIVNLESPITESSNKNFKTGPHIKGNRNSTKEVLNELNINLVTLANNHILDYQEEGLKDTVEFCEGENIKTVGAGDNNLEAAQPFSTSINKYNVIILNYAENEWSNAEKNKAGANSLNVIRVSQDIKKYKKSDSDILIVIVHGGNEYYNLPSPRMQEQYRFFIENGADLVVGHHSHCISGYENYLGKQIFYSLGNFLFTKSSHFKDWYEGLVLAIDIEDDRKIRTNLIPVKQNKANFALEVCEGKSKSSILSRINKFNSIISSEEELDDHWNMKVSEMSEFYLNRVSPITYLKNRYLKALFIKLRINLINKHGASMILNMLRCEAHSDMVKDVLKKFLK